VNVRLASMPRQRTVRTIAGWGGLVVVGLFLPGVVSPSHQYVASLVVIAALFTSATSFVVGYAGVASFGNQLFYAAGGYATGYLVVKQGVHSVFLLLLVSTLIGAVVAVLLSVLLREQIGLGFGMITLAVGQLVYLFVYQTTYLYGLDGIPGILRGDLFGMSLATGSSFLRLCIVCLLVVLMVFAWVRSTMFGKILAGVRTSPDRATALGVPIRRYRVVALALSGAFCGTAGCLYALAVGAVAPDMFSWTTGATPVLAGIIGGIRTLAGPVLGGVIFESASDLLSGVSSAYQLITAGIVLVIFVVRPEGILAHVEHPRTRVGGWLSRARRGGADHENVDGSSAADAADPEPSEGAPARTRRGSR
jgi:branched-chain amino acid transport system permease protein